MREPQRFSDQVVAALMPDKDDAHYAVQDLLANGIEREAISISTKGEVPKGQESLAGEGALLGASEGLVFGGLFGALIGIASMFFLPTGIIILGPLVWAIAGAGTGAAAGGLAGALIGYGIPKEEAEDYALGVEHGGTLILVKVTDANIDLAEELLARDGAVQITSQAEAQQPAVAAGP